MERQKHLQMYPHWNARDNYRFGLKKKKRKRDKADDPGKNWRHLTLRFFPFFLRFQWHSLSRDEQSKYYELARKERSNHMKLHPNWTAKENYAKHKKKRKKRDKIRDGNGKQNKLVFIFVHKCTQ